jgi:lysophospholipase L1-like esterase
VGTRNDDISLILAKAKKQGFLPDVKDEEVDILRAEASSLFNDDVVLMRRKIAVPIATNTWTATNTPLQTNNGTFRSLHVVPFTATDLQFSWANFAITNTGDAPNGASMLLRAGIKYNGTIYRVFFGGATDQTIVPGGRATSDPLSIVIQAGTTIEVLTYIECTSWYPVSVSGFSTLTGGYSASDLTAPGSATVPDAVKYMFSPSAIIGTPLDISHKAVSIEGDSISVGSGSATNQRNASYADTPNTPYGGGFIQRALANKIPYIHVGRGGETAIGAATGRYLRMTHQHRCSSTIVEYGVNDITGGVSLSQLQNALLDIWKAASARGSAVFQTTITPVTTSTDAWATTANQTVTANELKRTQLNDWIRTVPAPLTGYFEIADIAETSRNSGIWKAAGTADGTHPTEAMYELLKAGITIDKLK